MYDLKSEQSFVEIEGSEWIEKAMMQLYIEEASILIYESSAK